MWQSVADAVDAVDTVDAVDSVMVLDTVTVVVLVRTVSVVMDLSVVDTDHLDTDLSVDMEDMDTVLALIHFTR